MTIAVIWSRFGPYHLARLRGAAESTRRAGASIVGIEVAQRDHYAWTVQGGSEGFQRWTLFPERGYESLPGRAIRTGLAHALDDLRPRAVAVNGWSVTEARAATSWCRRNAVPAVLMSETKEDDGPTPRSWWREKAKSLLVRRCGAALVGGRQQAHYLTKLGFPSARIFLGYDVVDNDYFAHESDRARASAGGLRRRLGLPERYFFACTRFLPRKNLDGLLRAYAAYRRAGEEPCWGLVIAGGGGELSALQALERRLAVSGVVWAGFIQYDLLPAYFGLASAFVHSATAEPWGLVVNEAAASGLPLLVGNRVGAGYELVRDGENGLLFDAEKDAEIAKALSTVASAGTEQRAAMGARSRKIVADWSPRRFGEQLLAAVLTAEAGPG